jgi:hypothetical protein
MGTKVKFWHENYQSKIDGIFSRDNNIFIILQLEKVNLKMVKKLQNNIKSIQYSKLTFIYYLYSLVKKQIIKDSD